jgi:starvation-inducible DNA-binding protein
MIKTHNDLSAKVRESVGMGLNQLLADASDMAMQAKQAHWALRGPNFIALHKLFDDVYEHAGEWADAIAERAAALGQQPKGTLQSAATATRLEPYPVSLVPDHEHVQRIALALGRFGAYLREAIAEFDKLGDAGSADLATEISREVDKDLWFVEAHLG